MIEIDKFLAECRECKRALAVKLDLMGFASPFIEELLNVSASFIRKWRVRYQKYGIDSLYVQYKGSEGYLSPTQRAEIIAFLMTKDYYGFDELCAYVEEHYGVVYKTKQSIPLKVLHRGTCNFTPWYDHNVRVFVCSCHIVAHSISLCKKTTLSYMHTFSKRSIAPLFCRPFLKRDRFSWTAARSGVSLVALGTCAVKKDPWIRANERPLLLEVVSCCQTSLNVLCRRVPLRSWSAR